MNITAPVESTTENTVVEIQDIIDKLNIQLLDVSKYYEHTSTNSLDVYYNQLIESIVFDLTIIPVNRDIQDFDSSDSKISINAGMVKLADKLAWFFFKGHTEVEQDLVKLMNTFPVDDARNARWLRHSNMLN
jgi:hypothetical protein